MLIFIIITLSLFILYISSQNTQQYYNYMEKKKREYIAELGQHMFYAPITTKTTTTPSPQTGTTSVIKPPTASGTPISKPECVDFINKFEKPICVCKNVIHAKCRDFIANYVPINDDEKRCAEYVKTFKGDICECMNNFHDKCQ